MNDDTSRNKGFLFTLFDNVRSFWQRLTTLDERTRLNLLLTIFNLMLLIIVVFALLNRRTEVRYEIVVQTATVAQATATAAQAAAYSEGVEVGATRAVETIISQLTATALAQPTVTPIIATPTLPPATVTFTPLPPTVIPTLPPPPTATPTPLSTDTPTPSPSPTAKAPPPPRPSPIVLSITPNQGANSAPVPVIIRGANFFGLPTAWLGSRESSITISDATADMLVGTVEAGLIPGVYGLTVTNPDNKSGTLWPGFTVYDFYGPTIPLESPYLALWGTNAVSPQDSGYQVQLIFFEVPADLSENLYVRIFDADTGGPSLVDYMSGSDDTVFRYTLYGLTGAYTAPEAQTAQPLEAGITSGTPLVTATIGMSATLDNTWNFRFGPFSPNQGELVGGRYIFKLAVEALGGDDANWYQVELSTSPDVNTAPLDLRMFAFSWILLVDGTHRPQLHPYVRGDMTTFRLRSYGCNYEGYRLPIWTPFRTLETWCSGDGRFTPEDWPVGGESGTTWTVDFSQYAIPGSLDYLGVWAEDGNSQALSIFTRPMLLAPP